MQGSFALSGATVLGPAFGFVGQPVDRLFDPMAMLFDPLFVEFAGYRQSGAKDHARSGAWLWDGEAIPGRSAVGAVVSDPDGDDGDLEERAELDGAWGQDSAGAFGAVWGDD